MAAASSDMKQTLDNESTRRSFEDLFRVIESATSKEDLKRRLAEGAWADSINTILDNHSILFRVLFVFYCCARRDPLEIEAHLWQVAGLIEYGANPLLGGRSIVNTVVEKADASAFSALSLLCEYGGGLVLKEQIAGQRVDNFVHMLWLGAKNKTQKELSEESDKESIEQVMLERQVHLDELALIDMTSQNIVARGKQIKNESDNNPEYDFNSLMNLYFNTHKILDNAVKDPNGPRAKYEALKKQKAKIKTDALAELKNQLEGSELVLAARRRSTPNQITWIFSGRELTTLLIDHIDGVETNDLTLPYAESIIRNLVAASQCPISRPVLAPAALTALDDVRKHESQKFATIREILLDLTSSTSLSNLSNDFITICCAYLTNPALVNQAGSTATNGVAPSATASISAAALTPGYANAVATARAVRVVAAASTDPVPIASALKPT